MGHSGRVREDERLESPTRLCEGVQPATTISRHQPVHDGPEAVGRQTPQRASLTVSETDKRKLKAPYAKFNVVQLKSEIDELSDKLLTTGVR